MIAIPSLLRIALLLCVIPGILCAKNPCANLKKGASIIIENACPGEGCQFGNWTAKKAIPLFDVPEGKVVGKLRKDESFEALDGQTHAMPMRGTVLRTPKPGEASSAWWELMPKKGEPIYLASVLDHEASGTGVVCFRSKTIETTLEGIALGSEVAAGDWAKVTGEPKQQWWVKVRLKNRSVRWISFDREQVLGADRFG